MRRLFFQVTVCVVCQDVMDEKEDVRVWGAKAKEACGSCEVAL